jgi:NAD(P)-dependent dehydrogenase (short-subunit alcohol dehydrogenase family)
MRSRPAAEGLVTSIWERRALDPAAILLHDGVAVVTGAARGIGAATAIALARFGAHVAVCDRDAEGLAATRREVEALGRRAVSSVLDVREEEAVRAFLAEVGEVFGRVSTLVNNAGGGFYAPFLEVSAKGESALVRENFGSVTNFVRATVPLMRRGGSIVNVTSVEAHRAGPGFAIYSAMKAAVANLTKSLALELAPRRIRVNCIAPDMIPTAGDAALAEASSAMALPGVASAPWPETGSVWDCAAAVVFLASDLSRFITGSTLHVDGGTEAAGGWKRRSDGGFTL